jgi:hypothetical protein
MFANKFKININTVETGTTATTITIPFFMDFQTIDNSELIERVFVDTEVENAINPIIDYEKVRFLPLNLLGDKIDKIIYDIYLLDSNGEYKGFYGDIGFTDSDIKYRKESFKKTFLNLSFYDSDNPLTQQLVNFMTLYAELNSSDLLIGTPSNPLPANTVPGTPKPAVQIPINFVVEDPLINPRGFAEGYHLYYYKSSLNNNIPKYLYMRASFKNSKTGKNVNLMVKNTAQPIDKLVHELYTRFKLTRTTTGFYYEIDNLYQGNLIDDTSTSNNVTYNSNSCTVTLYEIKAA